MILSKTIMILIIYIYIYIYNIKGFPTLNNLPFYSVMYLIPYIVTTQNQIKSNHFYCHITTAQVPW